MKESNFQNPATKENIRDHASVEGLVHSSNIQALNFCLIKWDTPKEKRTELLQEFITKYRKIYPNSVVIDRLNILDK